MAEQQTTEKMYYVYKTTCSANGKIYIGKSSYIGEKPDAHYIGSGRYIRAAIRKYGKHFFTKEVLYENLDSRLVYEKEAQLIAEYNSTNHAIGYNISRGYSKSDEYLNQDYKAAQSCASRKVWANYTSEQRAARCKAIKDSWTEDRRLARSTMLAARLNDPVQAATYKEHLSEGVRRVLKTEDYRARHRAAMNRPDVRERIHAARVAQGQDPWQKELNKQVRQPLSVVSKLLRNNKISLEEAQKRRHDIEIIRARLLEEKENGNNA